MKCTEIREEILDLAIADATVRPEIHEHLEACPSCRKEWESMRSTMALLDTWEAPEPSPFFDTKLNARLRAEAAAPQGWRERIREAGLSIGWRPVTALALAVAMAIGIGVYQSKSNAPAVTGGPSAVADLQELDKNQQLLNDIAILDETPDSDSQQTDN